MIFIWGWKAYVTLLASGNLVCARCSNPAAHRLHERKNKFTFFWIPLFVTSRKYFLDCTFCGQQTKLTREAADQCAAQLDAAYPTAQQRPTHDQR